MTYQHALVFYQPITPLHVGCGQDVGVVDLPVIRERTTGYPFLPGSGIRGSVRERFEAKERGTQSDRVNVLFGPLASPDEEARHAGCVAVHDAKILLFPVRSDQKVFLWLTCPAVLQRFARDLEAFTPGSSVGPPPLAGSLGDEAVCGPADLESPIFLEEFSFSRSGQDGDVSALAGWAEKIGRVVGLADLAQRTVLVSDRTFHYFVTHATLILQHNRLTAAKTVEEGGLFSVEAVPPEAIFYGFFGATEERRPVDEGRAAKSREEILDEVKALGGDPAADAYLHLGGDESTGLGVTRIVWHWKRSGR
jgi:CRISPR-associated protein Cmr4